MIYSLVLSPYILCVASTKNGLPFFINLDRHFSVWLMHLTKEQNRFVIETTGGYEHFFVHIFHRRKIKRDSFSWKYFTNPPGSTRDNLLWYTDNFLLTNK